MKRIMSKAHYSDPGLSVKMPNGIQEGLVPEKP
jgi:hypothetical protein